MHLRLGLLCVCWVLVAQNAFAQGADKPLSLPEAVDLALRQNPLMTAARQRIEQSKGNLTSARALPNPALQVVPFGSVNDNPVILYQTFDVFGKLGLRTKAARYSLQAVEVELRATELQVRYEVIAAYVDLLAAQRVRQLNAEAVRLARTLHETTVQRLSAGDVPVVDTTRSQIELARAEQELAKAEGEVDVKKAALNTALGRDPATAIAVTGELSYQPREWDVEQLKQFAYAARPEMKAAERELQARQTLVAYARAQRNPDLVLQGRTGRAEGGADRARVGFGFTLPMLDWGGIRGQTRAAKAAAAEQTALLTRVKQLVALEVESAYRRLRTAQRIVESYQRLTLPQSEDLLRRIQAGYPEGITILQLIDAQRTYTDGRIGYARAVADYQRALAELERAVGGRLPDTEGRTQKAAELTGEGLR